MAGRVVWPQRVSSSGVSKARPLGAGWCVCVCVSCTVWVTFGAAGLGIYAGQGPAGLVFFAPPEGGVTPAFVCPAVLLPSRLCTRGAQVSMRGRSSCSGRLLYPISPETSHDTSISPCFTPIPPQHPGAGS